MDTTRTFERLVLERDKEHYVLKLYVTGMTARSTDAIAVVKAVCEELLAGRYDLEVIDIYRDPNAARDEQIVAVPTLVRALPLPRRRLVGGLADHDRIAAGLKLRPREPA